MWVWVDLLGCVGFGFCCVVLRWVEWLLSREWMLSLMLIGGLEGLRLGWLDFLFVVFLSLC